MRPLLVAAACLLAACGARPTPTPARAEDPKPAAGTSFSGTVGQLDESNSFIEFISNREKQTVSLDVRFPAAASQGGEESESEFFVVWDECDNLPEGEKPGTGRCTGFEYTIPKTRAGRALVEDRDGHRLRGRFRIEPAGGPLQGLVLVGLVPAQ